jgi:hypothetical protein
VVLELEMLANLLMNQLGPAGGMLVLPGGAPGCMTISSFTDSDADGIPDDSDFVYSSSGCQFDIENGFGTTSGSVRVTDPGAAFGFSAAVDDLAYTMTNRPTATVTFSFSTPVPIRFDPACESPFPTAGEVHAQVVSGGPEGYVKIRWSSCGGEADVDWVEG